MTTPACATTPRADGRLPVVTTTTQLTDFARAVGGDRVRVYGILGPNVDPHDYEPSAADLEAIATARVIAVNGVGLEAWLAPTIASAEPTAPVTDASRGIAVRRVRPGPGGRDPHIWHDPRNAERMVATVAEAMERADPAHASEYRANTRRYLARLRRLDRWIAARIATLPDRRLVTDHDALGYYAARYGLRIEGSIIPGFDSAAELSAAGVRRLVHRIRASGVRAIFSESSLPRRTADAIGREAGVRVVAGDGSLYGDTLGPPGSPGDTYLRMEAHNTRVIVDNLR